MKKTLIGAAATLALSGCISFGAKPPPFLLDLNATAAIAAGTTHTAGAGQAVTIAPPSVPAALATNRVPVRSADTTVSYVKDAQWVEAPNRLFRRLLAETVTAKTGRLVLGARQFSFDPGLRISGELQNFGIDARTMEAIVTFDATKAAPGGEQIEERRFEARVPVDAIESGPVGVAINAAANQVAAEVAAWVGG